MGSSLGPCCRDGRDRKDGGGAVPQGHGHDRFQRDPGSCEVTKESKLEPISPKFRFYLARCF